MVAFGGIQDLQSDTLTKAKIMARPINRELADPMDRESSRTRRRDSMSADGLSYSVANDLEKQMGQALAEYDARRKAPRSDVWGKTLKEDSPEQLRTELLDPFMRESSRQSRTAAPRTYKAKNATGGDDVVSFDPQTGETKVVYSVPGKPEKDIFFSNDVKAIYRNVDLASKAVLDAGTDRQRALAHKDLVIAKKALDEFKKAPKPAATAPATALESPIRKPIESYGFISNTDDSEGIPLGENRFQTKISKNGRLPKSLAADLMSRYKGDKEMARKEAEKMGYTTEFIE